MGTARARRLKILRIWNMPMLGCVSMKCVET
jgi:hypothetical protein